MFPGRLPWRGAREVIDWSNPGRSLMDDPKYRKKPLSVKTRRRIARGLERFGGPLAPLYIRLLELPESDGAAPPPDSEQAGGPFLLNRHGENGYHRSHSVKDPVPTATGRGAGYLVQPFLLGQQSGGAPRSTHNPLPTVAAGGAIALVLPDHHPMLCVNPPGGGCDGADQPHLVQPSIIQYYGNSYAQAVDAPLSVITSMNKHGLVCPTLVEYYGRSDAADVESPLPTVTGKARHGLVNPTLIEVNHGDKGGNERHTPSLDGPLPSPTTKRAVGLASPVLVQTSQTGGNGGYSRPVNAPVPVLTSRNDLTIVTPTAQPYSAQVHAQDSGAPVSPLLDDALLRGLDAANLDPRRVVLVDGHLYILDIRFRMLQNAELARAMGFEDGEAPYEFVGTTSDVTKQIGNAVPVNVAAALVRSALERNGDRNGP